MCGSGNFYRGWSRPDGKKTALTAIVCACLFCVVLNLLTEGFQWFYFREGLSYEDFSDIPKYHFNQYKLNMNIYKCFRTGASQSKHNMCGSRNFNQAGVGGGGGGGPDPTARKQP